MSNESTGTVTECVSFEDFLVNRPPSTWVTVRTNLAGAFLEMPRIEMHCSNCEGQRNFVPKSGQHILADIEETETIVRYVCSNCNIVEKKYSILTCYDDFTKTAKCYKFGELPPFGPHTPPKLMKLIGSDRDLFFKGRRCESQGLGVGAFTYYRRVVENQKDRIIDNILKLSRQLSAPQEQIDLLENAKKEVQFSKAIKPLSKALPESLLINGHNPLTLLYKALSDGVHDQSDEHCLNIAQDVRIVLMELSERLAQALKDEAELNGAVSRLMKLNSK